VIDKIREFKEKRAEQNVKKLAQEQKILDEKRQ